MARIGLLARLTEPGVHIYGADAIGGEGVAFERLGLEVGAGAVRVLAHPANLDQHLEHDAEVERRRSGMAGVAQRVQPRGCALATALEIESPPRIAII
jgi:hypothetical protein